MRIGERADGERGGGGADGGHLAWWDPGREEVHAPADVVRHAQGRREGVDGAGGVGEEGEAGDVEVLADGEDVVWGCG